MERKIQRNRETGTEAERKIRRNMKTGTERQKERNTERDRKTENGRQGRDTKTETERKIQRNRKTGTERQKPRNFLMIVSLYYYVSTEPGDRTTERR